MAHQQTPLQSPRNARTQTYSGFAGKERLEQQAQRRSTRRASETRPAHAPGFEIRAVEYSSRLVGL